MSFWVDQKYISMLSTKLTNFTRKGEALYNFRCPICNDSKKSKNKSRGFLYSKSKGFKFHCHNCGSSMNFKTFLQTIDLMLYNQYCLETLADQQPEQFKRSTFHPKKIQSNIFDSLETVSSLSPKHFCKQYVVSRKIPNIHHRDLFFCDNFSQFVNQQIPDKLNPKYKESRLIIPFYLNQQREVIGFQGRSLHPVESSLRYITIILNEQYPRVYGLHSVNFNKKYYVFEGPIDSMMIDNSIAIGGSDLVTGLNQIQSNKDNAVIVFDNEPRNVQIVKKIHQAISRGLQVVIWPSNIETKDVNKMIVDGEYNSSELNYILDANTYKGLEAEIAFSQWQKAM